MKNNLYYPQVSLSDKEIFAEIKKEREIRFCPSYYKSGKSYSLFWNLEEEGEGKGGSPVHHCQQVSGRDTGRRQVRAAV